MSSYSLPGISRIDMMRCKDLPPNLMMHSVCGCMVALSVPSIRIDFSGRPVLSCEGTSLNGCRMERATLEFSSTTEIPEEERLAFVVTSAGGEQYLVGTAEPRYPVVSYTDTTGQPGSTPSVRTYKVTLVARKAVIPCVL